MKAFIVTVEQHSANLSAETLALIIEGALRRHAGTVLFDFTVEPRRERKSPAKTPPRIELPGRPKT